MMPSSCVVSSRYFVMEMCSGGDLFERIPYTEKQSAIIVNQICSAVSDGYRESPLACVSRWLSLIPGGGGGIRLPRCAIFTSTTSATAISSESHSPPGTHCRIASLRVSLAVVFPHRL